MSVSVIMGMQLPLIGVDDANILFVYSKHLAEGYGLVYNIGAERVEGFSSTLWMLIASAGFVVSEQPTPFLFVLNLVLVGSGLAYGSLVMDRLTPDGQVALRRLPSRATLVWLTWIFANPDFFIWTTTSLMETGLWTALLLSTFWLMMELIRSQSLQARSLAVFAGIDILLLLTRPESMAWVLYFAAMLGIVLRANGLTWQQTARHWLPVALAVGATLALLIAFRLSYFGFPLPNTYYAKMAPDRLYEIGWGVSYLRQFVAANPITGVLILIAVFEFIRLAPGIFRTVLAGAKPQSVKNLLRFTAASAALAGIAIPILMGGDIFGGYRFFQPTWPLLILPLLLLAMPGWAHRPSLKHYILVGTIAMCMFTLVKYSRWTNLGFDANRVAHLYELTRRGIITGQYVQEIFPEALPTIGASAAGGSKMGYPGIVIDTMGLNFTPMAHHDGDKRGTRGHAAFNKDVFWQYAPDLLEPSLCPATGQPENRYNDPDNWIYQIYRQIFDDPEFNAAYRYIAVQAPESGGWVCTYIKRELAAELEASGNYQFKAVLD
jgi:hypothetical protein